VLRDVVLASIFLAYVELFFFCFRARQFSSAAPNPDQQGDRVLKPHCAAIVGLGIFFIRQYVADNDYVPTFGSNSYGNDNRMKSD
jgi:hypothetical protein